MKIALLGSAPSSLTLAPFGDQTWQIWGCSPGVYWQAPRMDVFFELHRWEPGVIGQPNTQKPWFSPEYCAWLARQACVYMAAQIPEIPNSRALPWQELVQTYGHYNFTSSLAWMAAMAIDAIKADRKRKDRRADLQDAIGFWGVDMSATEEYGYQRAGCQFFAQIAGCLGIQVVVPPESDLLLPPPLYGISESWPKHIKLTARLRELQTRRTTAAQNIANAQREHDHLAGAIDDLNYQLGTWVHEGSAMGASYPTIFEETWGKESAPPAAADLNPAPAGTPEPAGRVDADPI